MDFKKIGVWFLAIAITLAAVVYQRATGPTYPKKFQVSLSEHAYGFALPRSHGGTTDCPVVLEGLPEGTQAVLHYRHYPFLEGESWQSSPFSYTYSHEAFLPNQPPAGKLAYFVELRAQGQAAWLGSQDAPILIRFKGDVPTWALAPHVLAMFLAMLLSTLAGLSALFGLETYRRQAVLAFAFLTVGGMVLGPIVQKFAFGDYWTGIPWGWDLTDNKTLVAFLFWLAAVLLNRKAEKRWAVVLASVALLLVYSIPHSAMGSELDRSSGQVTQGDL